MKIGKAPGHDWTVTFRWEDGEPELMSVFGAMTIEKAVKEARYSHDPDDPNDPDWPSYEILAIVRADIEPSG